MEPAPRDEDGSVARVAASNRTAPRLSPPYVTWILIAVNVVIFGLEMVWGGSRSTSTLYHMGANFGAALTAEPWRVLSSAFLHIGPLHLALNMWALLMFGAKLEQFLGSARLLTLYGAAAVGGGIVSALRGSDALSAGASGAVWGLMLAEIVVILRLHRHFNGVWRGAGLGQISQPLLVNLVYSFLPGIDLAAHLGGAFVGGLVAAAIRLPPRREGLAWRALAAVSALLMMISLGLAWKTGRPWDLP